jgi:hypothetical protein
MIVSKLSGSTDINGEVNFSGVEVNLEEYRFLPRMQKIDSEMLFVNLEPSEEAKQRLSFEDRANDRYELLFRTLPKLDRVEHPNAKYSGYVLETVNLISEAHDREQENATFEFRPEDFRREEKAYFAIGLHERPAPMKR